MCVIKAKKKIEIKQFTTSGDENETKKQRIELFEAKVIRSLKRLLYANKAKLLHDFKAIDPKKSGYISVIDWANLLTDIYSKIPWVKYKDKLVEISSKGLVRYESSFENCDVLYTFTTEHRDINDALAKYKDTLGALFNLIDDNHSGTINLNEFANACKVIFHDQNESISDQAIKSMIEAMDTNRDGKIDLAEFSQAFVVYV